MNRDDVRRTFLEVLGKVAPDLDPDGLDPKESLREQADLDSMDMRGLVQRLHERLGVDVPESEHGHLDTVDGAVDWLVAHLT